MTNRRHPQTDPTRVSFRLDPEMAAELASRAQAAGKSRGIYARDLLCEALFQGDEQRHQLMLIRAEVTRFITSLDTLRSLPADLVSSVYVLLVHAGKLSPEQARQWIQQTLRHNPHQENSPCSPSD